MSCGAHIGFWRLSVPHAMVVMSHPSGGRHFDDKYRDPRSVNARLTLNMLWMDTSSEKVDSTTGGAVAALSGADVRLEALR